MLLLDTMATSSPPYILNYDVRSRNTPMESSLAHAHTALTECVERLRREVPQLRLDEQLTLNAVTPYPQTLQSTFGREVCALFNIRLSRALTASVYLALVCWASCRASLVYGMWNGSQSKLSEFIINIFHISDSCTCWRACQSLPRSHNMFFSNAFLQGIHLAESFGFAPSTLVHHGTDGPLGKAKI
jgi:hypothetical protein